MTQENANCQPLVFVAVKKSYGDGLDEIAAIRINDTDYFAIEDVLNVRVLPSDSPDDPHDLDHPRFVPASVCNLMLEQIADGATVAGWQIPSLVKDLTDLLEMRPSKTLFGESAPVEVCSLVRPFLDDDVWSLRDPFVPAAVWGGVYERPASAIAAAGALLAIARRAYRRTRGEEGGPEGPEPFCLSED